jgi:hypothetical protein
MRETFQIYEHDKRKATKKNSQHEDTKILGQFCEDLITN